MGFSVIRCLVIFVAIPMILSTPVKLEKEKIVEIRLVEERSNARIKRTTSESNLPEHLEFDIPTVHGDARLRLTRRSLLPLYDSDGLVSNTVLEEGVYVDYSKHSAMIVKRSTDEYHLKGIFTHGDTYWELKPLERKKRSAKLEHSINEMDPDHEENNKVISFAGDQAARKSSASPPKSAADIKHEKEASRDPQNAYYNHVVEIAFVVDHEDYLKWRQIYDYAPDSALRMWYTYVAESMAIRYQSIFDRTISINTTVTHLRVLRRSVESYFIDGLYNETTNSMEALDALKAFTEWINHDADIEDKPIPTSDHYMLFTGHDFGNTAGIAWLLSTCTNESMSVSVNRFDGFMGLIAAHELGHSLGAYHDRDSSYCSDSSKYVMASSITLPSSYSPGNMWKFSSCSVSYFKNYLDDVSCTRYWNTYGVEVLPAPQQQNSKAGQALDRYAQCRLHFNSSSYYCSSDQSWNGGMSSICRGLYCFDPAQDDCVRILPQEFTYCGYRKWCVKGSCINNYTTTTSTTTTTTTRRTTTTTTPTTTTTTRPKYRNPYLKCAIHLFEHNWNLWLACLRNVFLEETRNILEQLG